MGREKNVKAKFIGYNSDINGVPNGNILPLSEKWVWTLSTQYGCQMNCRFCDCPKIKFAGNASYDDLVGQMQAARNCSRATYAERLNIHFARMGEPIFNMNVFDISEEMSEGSIFFQKRFNLRVETVHPVLTTSLPKSLNYFELQSRLIKWCDMKNYAYRGQAGLQLSINSTDDSQRDWLFDNMSLSINKISDLASKLPDPVGRKYCLNFALADDSKIDANILKNLFDTNKFMVKLTPIHNNNACINNNIKTEKGYTSFTPYKKAEEELIDAGFDVLIFIPSMDEENGLVTCGNAILSGSSLRL